MESINNGASSDLLALNKKLLKAGKKDANKFLYAFLDREDAIIDCLKSIGGVKSEIYLREVDDHLGKLLRFSSIFSDLTIVNTASSKVNATEITMFQPESSYFRERKLSFPSKLLPEIGTDPDQFRACYINRPDAAIKKIFTSYEPFIRTGRLVVRPLRGIYVNHPGANAGSIYYVYPNTPNDHWYVDQVENRDTIFIDNGLDQLQMLKLFELTLPYFEGTPIKNLEKILEDEAPLLSSFRSQLYKMIREAGGNLYDLRALQNDIIQPEIDKVGRKFRTIADTHRMTVTGSVSTFTLSLVIASFNGNLMQILAGAVPTVGAALMVSERIFQERLGDLKDNPFFLLWRINKHQ